MNNQTLSIDSLLHVIVPTLVICRFPLQFLVKLCLHSPTHPIRLSKHGYMYQSKLVFCLSLISFFLIVIKKQPH